MSGDPSIKGIRKFPKPPIIKGITIKKIIINAWLVTMELKVWSLRINELGDPNSNRIIILIEEPISPDQIAKIKYKIPISLWLVEYNHLFIY